MTARENVIGTLEALDRVSSLFVGRGRALARAKQADDLLEFFCVDADGGTPVSELPLGRAKLVELAKVFAGSPKVVLLDEPFAGLGLGEASECAELIHRRRDATGAAVLIVEHNVDLVLGLCDEMTVLDYGKVIATGRPRDVVEQAVVREAYLGDIAAEGGP
jgi:ABC-type branched-subunit amino acid transport system ATPase component